MFLINPIPNLNLIISIKVYIELDDNTKKSMIMRDYNINY